VRKVFCDAYSIFREWGDENKQRLVMRIMSVSMPKVETFNEIVNVIAVDVVGAAAPSQTTRLVTGAAA